CIYLLGNFTVKAIAMFIQHCLEVLWTNAMRPAAGGPARPCDRTRAASIRPAAHVPPRRMHGGALTEIILFDIDIKPALEANRTEIADEKARLFLIDQHQHIRLILVNHPQQMPDLRASERQ